MSGIARLRDYRGPIFLSNGFRPFFLFGAIYAGLAVLAWLPMFDGELKLWTDFSPVDWHVHEMLYGYLPAVVTGFLLTAIPNWTGRLPLQGLPLLVLVSVWVAGRVAVTLSAETGWLLAAIIDVSFLALVVAATSREIIVGKNWRNLRVVGLVTFLLAGNIAFHIEAHAHGTADCRGTRHYGRVEYPALGPLGGRSDLPRPVGAYSACRLRVLAARLSTRRRGGARHHCD